MKFIDLFAGIGGFRLGMEMAGHECVGWCEIDKYARKSYIAMHNPKESEWFAEDITRVTDESIRLLREQHKVDVICAGFPCQPFSIAGKRRGFEDTRGTLFFEIARFARILKPEYLFLENVKGLLNHQKGATFTTILNTLDELGYDAEWQVLNSKNFGVPQNRERLFIIGHLRGRSTRKVFPITGSNSQTLKQVIGGQQGIRVYDPSGTSCTLSSQGGGWGAKTGLYLINKNEGEIKFRDIANCIDTNYYKGLDNHQARTGVLEVRACLTPERLNKRQNGRRFKEPGEPMFTLTKTDVHEVVISDKRIAGWVERDDRIFAYQGDAKRSTVQEHVYIKPEGMADALTTAHTPKMIDGYRIRKLTPKECFRLQGFPDEYFERAQSVSSDTQLYKQIGNTVTIPVIYEIAKRLSKEVQQ